MPKKSPELTEKIPTASKGFLILGLINGPKDLSVVKSVSLSLPNAYFY